MYPLTAAPLKEKEEFCRDLSGLFQSMRSKDAQGSYLAETERHVEG